MSKLTAGNFEVSHSFILSAAVISGDNPECNRFIKKFLTNASVKTLRSFLKFTTGSSSITFNATTDKL